MTTDTQTQEPKEQKMARFELFNHQSRQTVCLVEMDEALLDPAKDLIDPETMTFKGIKYGNQFTLIPLDDHRVATLKRVKEVYEYTTKKPAALFSTHIHRMDELIQAVGLLFSEIEYFRCDSKAHFEMLINPRSFEERPPKVKYNILGDLLAEVDGEQKQECCGSGKCGSGECCGSDKCNEA